MYNYRIVNDFIINIEFYCKKLGFEHKEGKNTDGEEILTLTYEENTIQFMLKRSIKDVTKYLSPIDEFPMQIEVQNLEDERNIVAKNEILFLDYTPYKEFLFKDCNGFMVKYFQYEAAKFNEF